MAERIYDGNDHKYGKHPIFKSLWVSISVLHLAILKLIALYTLENNYTAPKYILSSTS